MRQMITPVYLTNLFKMFEEITLTDLSALANKDSQNIFIPIESRFYLPVYLAVLASLDTKRNVLLVYKNEQDRFRFNKVLKTMVDHTVSLVSVENLKNNLPTDKHILYINASQEFLINTENWRNIHYKDSELFFKAKPLNDKEMIISDSVPYYTNIVDLITPYYKEDGALDFSYRKPYMGIILLYEIYKYLNEIQRTGLIKLMDYSSYNLSFYTEQHRREGKTTLAIIVWILNSFFLHDVHTALVVNYEQQKHEITNNELYKKYRHTIRGSLITYNALLNDCLKGIYGSKNIHLVTDINELTGLNGLITTIGNLKFRSLCVKLAMVIPYDEAKHKAVYSLIGYSRYQMEEFCKLNDLAVLKRSELNGSHTFLVQNNDTKNEIIPDLDGMLYNITLIDGIIHYTVKKTYLINIINGVSNL